jgi:hypothetical protein
MKYWLLAALLANLALFLVEFHSDAFESALTEDIENDRQKKPETYSSQDNGASDQIRLANRPVLFTGNSSEEAKKNESPRKVEQPVFQDNIPALDAKGLPWALGLSSTSGQPEFPTLVNSETDAANEKPVSSIPLSSPIVQTPTPTATDTLEFSEATINVQLARVESTPPPLLSAPPVSEKSESGEKTIAPPTAPENPQKSSLTETAQLGHSVEKSHKVENLTAPSSRPEGQYVKNKNGKHNSSAKEIPPPPQISHKQDNVLTACYMAGPVKHVETFNSLLREFRPQLTELVMSPTQGRKKRNHNSYVVYYPAPASMEESLLTATNLKNNHGIKDLYVINDGEIKGAISLGVFSNERNAESAKSKFEQKGLQVRIKPRFPIESAYKVRMRWTAQQEHIAEQLVDALAQSYPDTKRITSCE